MLQDRRGNVAVIFSLALFAVVGAVGSAIDYSRASSARAQAATVMDAAVLAAAIALRDDPSVLSDDDRASSLAEREVMRYYRGNKVDTDDLDIDVRLVASGNDTTIEATFAGDVDAAFVQLLGYPTIAYSGVASSVVAGTPFIDVTLVVDTSASMALGASAADISRLRSQFGCAFACHDNPGADSYSWAKANGVKLRYDLVRETILNFADYIESFNSGGRVQVQLYSFDNTLRQLSTLNASMSNLRKNLPTTPVTSSETEGATRFWEYGSKLSTVFKRSGDGSTRGKAMQIVLMLTDGVQDPNRTWTSKPSLRALVREFDWAHCDAVRKAGATMGVVQVPYMEMTWDWGYNVTLNQPSLLGRPGFKRIDDVTHALKQCGGDLYMSANTPDEVVNSFRRLFQQATPIRLAR
jgi:Flp pilus assembly protein TadG